MNQETTGRVACKRMTNETTTIPKNSTTKTSTFSVFWLEEGIAQSKLFITSMASGPLGHCEQLRKFARQGAPINHVCITADAVSDVASLVAAEKPKADRDWTAHSEKLENLALGAKTNPEKTSSFAVFWLEAGTTQCEIFVTNLSNPALEFCEHLRRLAKDGAPITHVCISPEMVDNAGQLGVSDKLPADYNWTMRRKAFVPGRPSGTLAGGLVTPAPQGQKT
jgi:hypothetical protein